LKKWKSLQIGARIDLGNSHAVVTQNVNVDT